MKQKMTALILGASSDMALAIAHEFAREGFNLILAARNVSRLEAELTDLTIRYQTDVSMVEFDGLDMGSHRAFYDGLPSRPDVVISVTGYLGNQEIAQQDLSEARKIIDTNFTGVVSVLGIAAEEMSACKQGSIIAISSVAGDRGRPSNYIYGSAKGGLSRYLEGLAARMKKYGVHVLDVRPGFVATRMTENLNLPAALTVTPDVIARDVFRAYRKNKNRLYTPWFWFWIMLIIRMIPRFIFNRLTL